MNPYNVLDLSIDATLEEITKAYRRLSKTCHPDTGGSSDRFMELNLAYTVLKDPVKRKLFDEHGIVSTEQANHVEKAINERIRDLAEQWVEQVSKGSRVSLGDFAMDGINSSLDKLEDSNTNIESALKKIEECKDRITYSGEVNLFHKVIDQKINTLKTGLHNNKMEIIIFKKIIEEVEKYEYDNINDDFERGIDPLNGLFSQTTTFRGFGGI